jgi:hypothetical protein
MSSLDLKKIIQVNFPINQYYKEVTDKKVVVLHHTVSGRGVDGDINSWLATAEKVATAFVIDNQGGIHQCYSSDFWAHHLGVKAEILKSKGYSDYGNRNTMLNKQSIAIEIDSWGGLCQSGTNWYPAKFNPSNGKYEANKGIKPVENVQVYDKGYRGFYGFEKYTVEQIESVRQLLVFFKEKHNLPLKYNEDMFEVSKNALDGKPGIWSHSSYRADKSDIHPQPELIAMLKSL